MGGDYAPHEIIRGAVQASREKVAHIILVGREDMLQSSSLLDGEGIEIVHADEVVAMDENPAYALRRKKSASISVATRLIKEGRADAVVSAGNTGAQMAAAVLDWGRIKGVSRPAIAAVLPTLKGGKVLIDVGANVDCRPQHLLQFAQMGVLYAEQILNIKDASVGLLNIGTEPGKGNNLVVSAYRLFEERMPRFKGNVEARDLPLGDVDVVVCDGFVGNVLLKFGEGLAAAMWRLIREEVEKKLFLRVGAALMLPGLKELQKSLDYSEYGGAPLLGVRGVSIVCHGSSKARAIRNAIAVARKCVEERMEQKLSEVIA